METRMREMRRKDKQLPPEEAWRILRKAEYAVMSMVDSAGNPYAIPISYAVKDESLYMHCAIEGTKLDLINNHAAVCVTAVGSTKLVPQRFTTEYESAVAFGMATIVTEEAEKLSGLMAIAAKYSPDFQGEAVEYINRALHKTVVIRVIIESIYAKASPPRTKQQ